MSVQLAKNETLIREFEYATGSSKVSKKLRVTTQRIIHEETAGKHLTVHREMPLADAKYVDAAFVKLSKIALLVWGLILMLIGGGLGAVAYLELLDVELFDVIDLNIVLLVMGGLIAFIGLILFFSFFGSKSLLFKCVISTNHEIFPMISISESSVVKKSTVAHDFSLELTLNRNVAKTLVEELGAAILEAKEFGAPVEKIVSVENTAPVQKITLVEKVVPVEKLVEPIVEDIVEEPAEGDTVAEETVKAVNEEVVHETIEIEVEEGNVANALKEAMQIAENAENADVKIEVVLHPEHPEGTNNEEA